MNTNTTIEYADKDTLKYINKLKEKSNYAGKLYDRVDLYELKHKYIDRFKEKLYYPHDLQYKVLFYFWTDNGKYLNKMQYKTFDTFFWKFVSIKDFLDIVTGKQKVGLNKIKFKILQWQGYNTHKLKKPKELKGIKMDRSIKGSERRIQIFRKEDDIWLKDLSYEIYRVTTRDLKTNKTLSTYCMDTQAWLKIEGLFPVLNNPLYSIIDIIQHIVRQERIIKENFHKDEYIGEDYCVAEHKWEKIIKNIIDIYNIKR